MRQLVAVARGGGLGLLVPALVASVALACGNPGTPPVTVTADTADQIFYGLKHNLTIDGVLRAHLEADTAFFYEASQRADLKRVHVTFYSPEGRETSRLTSDSGSYDWRSGDMEARGTVLAVTPDGRRLRTSVLRYDRLSDRLSGPVPFVFDAPDRHLEGESFESDPDFRNVVTSRPRRGRVTGAPGVR
ncbi:MAG TPA: LPS export ABC transporter periplasmic protein LptC [Gemmatimonadales bacterium]|nr:LPS export ABC transporter periplasmic protein LptC [Gemmatimonadales bacterium]